MSDVGYDYDAEQAALEQQLAELANARAQVQAQTRALESNLGSFRAEQQLADAAAHTASVELATAQGGDFYSPDVGQHVAPDGTVTYDFDAHLHAQGVDIDAGIDTALGASSVDWIKQADGSVVAFLNGFDNTGVGGYRTLQAASRTADGAHQADMRLRTLAPNVAEVWADADANQRQIIDARGFSSFLQLKGLDRLVLDGPYVTSQFTLASTGATRLGPFTLTTPTAGVTILLGSIAGTQAGVEYVFSWGWELVSSTSFYVDVQNRSAVTAIGTWSGFCVHNS
jgi:hypothetical protein